MNLMRLLILFAFVRSSVGWTQEIPTERKELNDLYEKSPRDWVATLKSLPATQKAKYIKFLRADLLEQIRRYPGESVESSLEHLMYLGDTAARDDLVKIYYHSSAVGRGADQRYAFRAYGDPEIIAMIAPILLVEEPFETFGTDSFSYPRSFDAASMIVAIAGNTPAFNSDVLNWARSFDDQRSPNEDLRKIVREWWHANEQFFKDKNFAAVQPGRTLPPDPAPEESVPEGTATSAKPLPLPSNPTTVQVPQESSNNMLAYVITGAIAILLASALFSRRSRTSR